jgi:hypothetical protein
MRRYADIVSRVLLLLFSLCLCLLIAEGGIRMFYGKSIVLFPRFHTEAQYGKFTIRRLRPNTTFWHRSADGSWKFTINSKGFRAEQEYTYEKPVGVTRILSLGDSHTQGFECRQDKTFSSVIQQFLAKRGLKVEVINAGVSGFGTAEELVFLENEGIRYSPDVAVLGLYANDFDDNIKSGLFLLNNKRLVTSNYRHTPGTQILDFINAIPPLRWLSQFSYFYSLLFNCVWDWQKEILLDDKTQQLYAEFVVQQKDDDPIIVKYKQELLESLVKRMYQFCRNNHIYFVILDIPQLGELSGYKSSIPEELLSSLRDNCDTLIHCRDALTDDKSLDDVFVPHGHRHISETTHMRLGVETAERIEANIKPGGTRK